VKTKASYFTKLFGFALLFFDRYCTWAKQNKKRFFCSNDNRTKEKKLFQEVFKSFSTLFLSLKNKFNQKENFH